MNNVTITGTLEDDPRLEHGPDGATSVMRVVVTDHRNRNDGTLTLEIVAHGARAETVARHLHRGRLVAVTGRLIEITGANQFRRWARLQIVASSIDFLDAPGA